MTIAELSDRFAPVDFDSVHRDLADDEERRRAAGMGTGGLAPLALRFGESAVTLHPGPTVVIASGTDPSAPCVVELVDERAFADFFHELRTAAGAQVSGAVRYLRGGYEDFDAWEPALRALYQGRPVYDPATVDRTGLGRTFDLSVDALDEIGAFVDQYGFAVVRQVFTTAEIRRIDAAVARLERGSTPDTPGTWWTTTPDGTPRPCQIHYTTTRAPEISWVDTDPRTAGLVEACLPDLVAHPDRMNGHFAVLKRPGSRDGLTDLPWHVDCGLGGHPLLCPGLHLGIQLTGSDPARGAFSVLAGSHASTVRRTEVDPATWPVVTVATEPGDVTIHVPHAFHAAPPPTADGTGRRTLYLGYGRPEAHALIGPGQSFDDLLSQTADDGFVGFSGER